MPTRYRITRLTLTAGDGGGGDPLPVADWGTDTAAIPETTVLAVEVTLDKAAKDPVTIPFTLGGTAVYKTDYEFRQDLTGGVYDRPIVTIAAGASSGRLFIKGLAVAANVSGTLTLAAVNDTWHDGATYTLTGATLGTTTQVLTFTIVDSATLTASFSLPASVVTEGDATVVHPVEVTLSDASPGGVTVDVDVSSGGGTAVEGADFDWPTPAPVTLTYASTERTKTVDFDILETATDTDDETLIIGLSNYVGCSAGVITEHTVTIRDDDVGTPAGEITLVDGDAEYIAEGNTLNVQVVYTGGKVHAPLKITSFTVLGSADGPSGVAAKAGEFRVLTPLPLVIPNGEDRANISVENVDDGVVTGPRDVQVKLVTILVPVGVTFGDYKNKYLVLEDEDVDTPEGDGDLLDTDGTRIAPERRQFDYTAPDLICRTKDDTGGLSNNESVEIASARAALALNNALGTGYSVGDVVAGAGVDTSAILRAGLWAEHIWTHLHAATHTNSGSVAIGTELDEVLIECKSDTWDQSLLACQTPFLRAMDKGSERTSFWNGDNSIDWTGAGNTVIRDVIFYTRPQTPPTCARMRGFFIDSKNGRVDNLRFDRIHFRGHVNSSSVCQVNAQFSGGATVGDFKMQGRIKLYDCQVDADANAYTVNQGSNEAPTRCIQAGPAAWDIRHPEAGMPWPAFWPAWEHILYLRCVVGETTYAALGVDPLDGTYTRASNCFINIITSERQPGHHPGATNKIGPYYSSNNTVAQLVNRPYYNLDADMSSGLLAFVRCRAVGFGGSIHFSSPGDAWKVHGHNGDILFKDCSVEPHAETNKCGGGIKIEQDGSGTTGAGPQGKFDLEQETGRFYSGTKLRIEGFRMVTGGYNNSGINVATGVEDVDLRKFQAVGWDGHVLSLGSSAEDPGTMYTRYLRVDNLVDPTDDSAYTGAFSAYPGFGNASLLVRDSYHANWRTDSDNVRTLTSDDVDNLPTEGPAGYTQTAGIVDQQYTNRLQSAWGTTGKVDPAAGSPAWDSGAGGTSVYEGNETPNKPKAEFAAATDHFQGEADYLSPSLGHIPVEFDGRCQSEVRVRFAVSGADAGLFTVQSATQQTWPTDPTWITAVSPVVIEPISGVRSTDAAPSGGDQGDAVLSGFQANPQNDVWDNDYEEAVFRIKADATLATGTKTVTLTLNDGADSDFETYPESGVYETCDVTGTQTRDFKIVPAVDYASLDILNTLISVTNLTAGGSTQVGRSPSANADSDKIVSTVTVEIESQPVGSDFRLNGEDDLVSEGDDTTVLTWVASDGLESLSISDVTGVDDDDEIVLRFKAGTYTNAVAGGQTKVTFHFNI